jgi:hypothetical protein
VREPDVGVRMWGRGYGGGDVGRHSQRLEEEEAGRAQSSHGYAGLNHRHLRLFRAVSETLQAIGDELRRR